MKRRLAPRQSWPSIAIKFEMCPWVWKLFFYRDVEAPTYWLGEIGPITFAFFLNHPWFFEGDEVADD